MAKPRKLRLDLACGQHPTEGFIGVDIWPGADMVVDLLDFPWRTRIPHPERPGKTLRVENGLIADRSVDEVVCNHFVEHIPMRETADGVDLLIAFMNELWRVLKPGARATITHPHSQSARAWWDPTHRRCIPFQTWAYFDSVWLKANGLDHYPITADFEVITVDGVGIANDVVSRHHEVQAQMMERQWNVVADTKVILERRR